ncbi:MAG: glycerate kinase [Nitrospirota bacterium]
MAAEIKLDLNMRRLKSPYLQSPDIEAKITSIVSSALMAVDPENAIRKNVSTHKGILTVGSHRYDLRRYKNIYIIGAGKASLPMTDAITSILGSSLITKGIIITKRGSRIREIPDVKVVEAGHPVPDNTGKAGAEEITSILKETKEDDLVFFLLSGGASALMPGVPEGITLEDKSISTGLLLKSGAPIHEVNVVRKHISSLKGGQLAGFAYPSQIITLILSDVIGNPLDIIGSGPTVPDKSNFDDAISILKRYGLWKMIPKRVEEYLIKGSNGIIAETPKEDHPAFNKVQNLIIGDNKIAVEAAERKARELGFNTLIITSFLEGESREAAKFFAAIAKEIHCRERPVKKKACVIAGGETTVTVKGSGMGGRCQEFALASAIGIKGLEKTVIVGFSTDGSDGIPDAAGALADDTTIKRADISGVDYMRYLQNNDSYNFFNKIDDLIITGPTNTNVNDLYLLFVL